MKTSYQPLWSNAVHEEWITALLRNRPDLQRPKLQRTRALMDSHFPKVIVTGFEERIDHLRLPDANDRHVLAAAIEGGANIIVATNLADFPSDVLGRHGLKAMHPDFLIRYFIEFYPDQACSFTRGSPEA